MSRQMSARLRLFSSRFSRSGATKEDPPVGGAIYMRRVVKQASILNARREYNFTNADGTFQTEP